MTRDVTAWAWSGIEPILLASCSWAWARLGPLSTDDQGTVRLHRRLDRDSSAAIALPTGRLGGFPTGRPWDFAKRSCDHCVISFTSFTHTVVRMREMPNRSRSRTRSSRIDRPSHRVTTML